MNPVRDALYALLTGDATLAGLLGTGDRVWFQRAPADSPTPFVVFDKASGLRTWAFRGEALRNQMWLVKAVDRGLSASTAEAIDERLDMLLNDAQLSLASGQLRYLRRQSDVDYPEDDGGEIYHHVGGLYRLVTDPT